MSAERILIIDDDTELCELIGEFLDAEGFRVEAVHNGPKGILRAQSGEHGLVILDVMLPGINGLEVLRRLRTSGCEIPVLMLTARGGDAVDRIVGLEVGADDYLAKPFNPRELVARIRAILRRLRGGASETAAAAPREVLTVGEVTLDTGARTAVRAGEEIVLTAAEFDVLAALLRVAGNVVSRDALMKAALGRGLSPYDRSVDMHLSNLRRKLGPAGEYIKTVRSVGYLYALPPQSVREAESVLGGSLS